MPADLVARTAGAIGHKDKRTIDTIPGADQDIDQVTAHPADLLEVAPGRNRPSQDSLFQQAVVLDCGQRPGALV